MDRRDPVTITNMCMIIDPNGKVLVQDRVNPDWAGIAFPGGHVESRESLTDAVIREVLEETGLTIHYPQLCGVKDWINEDGSRYIVLLYKTDRFEGELRPSHEGNIFWTELETLNELQLANGMKQTLEVFLQDDLSEYFYEKRNGVWTGLLK